MRLSVIVVTWNNENFIEQALASCIDENLHDYEVIVVHNASTDRTGELIQRSIIGHEQRFRIIENKKNEGLGEARNIGIKNAKGDYLMFLDGDDWYEPNALSDVATLLSKHTPDVLVFNYQRVWDTGGRDPNILTHLLAERDISSPDERKVILTNFSSSSNKAYRREYIKSIGVSFPKGFYEDIVWSFRTLFSAQTCYVTPTIVFNYRQRAGSITRSSDERHLDIIKQYRILIDYLSTAPQHHAVYGATAYKYGRSQIFNVMNRKIRLPQDKQSQFLKQSSELLDEWRSNLKINKIDPTLILSRTGSPLIYNIGRKLSTFKNYSRKNLYYIKIKSKYYLKKIIYNKIFCRLPINSKKVYFESYWGSKADCNPLAIANELHKLGAYNLIWGFDKKTVIPEDFPFPTVKKGTPSYYYTLATAGFLVSNTNLNNDVVKRSSAVHIQTQHGTPLKSMGIDIRPFNPTELNWNSYAKRCKRWDFLISSNPYSSRIWRQAMPYDYKVIETGYPRNDIFWKITEEQKVNLKKTMGIPLDKKVALYAPTWRERINNSLNVNPEDIKKALGDDFILLLRSHYFNQDSKEIYSEGIINVTNHTNSNEVCVISDILISDYSSIIFDYACLKRPIVILADDFEDYSKVRGVYFDIRKKAPGVVANDVQELLSILKNQAFNSPEAEKRLLAFNNEFCPWDDGFASKRVINEIFNI